MLDVVVVVCAHWFTSSPRPGGMKGAVWHKQGREEWTMEEKVHKNENEMKYQQQ